MRRYVIQVLSAFILNCGCLIFGIFYAWPASTYLLFKSDATPLHRPMGDWELSLLGSISSIACLVGYPLTGILLDPLGRKNCAILTACVRTMAWGLIAFSNRVEIILFALFLAGMTSSIFLVISIFISEFCNESIRGALTSSTLVFFRLGVLISYMTGGLLSYNAMVYVCLSLSVVSVMLLLFLKESPTLLMKKGMEEEAKKSIMFYTNSKPNSKEVLQEIVKIKKILNPEERETLNPEEEKLTSAIPKKSQVENNNFFHFIKKSKSSQRAFILSMIFMTINVFQGMAVVLVYSNPLFSEAIPEEILSVAWCSIILAIVSVVIGIIASYLTDRSGRRPLLIISSVAAALCHVALGTQIHLHWGPHWLTVTFIYLFTISYHCGAGIVPYVFTAEVFLPEVKSILAMLVFQWTFLCNFFVLFIFNPLVAVIGLGPVFYIFAAICFCSAIFSVFYLPETKGLTVDAIQLLFVKQKRNNVV